MAFIKKQKTDFGMEYEYWTICSFNVFYNNEKGIVDIVFSGYINKDEKLKGSTFYKQITQKIPFETFLEGFTNMSGFTDSDIKNVLYTLKNYYEFFNDATDDI